MGLARAKLSESIGEAGALRHLRQEPGDAHLGKEPIHDGVQPRRFRRDVRRQGRDPELSVADLHVLDRAPRERASESAQPPVQEPCPIGQVCAGRRGQTEARGGGRNLRARQEIGVEPAVAARAVDPDVARAEAVTKRGEGRRLVEPPVDVFALSDERLPAVGEWERSVGRYVPPPGAVQVLHQLDRGECAVAPTCGPEAEGFQERRAEAAQCHVLRRGAHERILVGRGGKRLHLRPGLLQPRPSDRLLDGFDRVDAVLARCGQGVERGVEQA